jgi:hypothetical protein
MAAPARALRLKHAEPLAARHYNDRHLAIVGFRKKKKTLPQQIRTGA